MNFFKNIFSSTYEELWKAVIRPNRDNYTEKDLGPDKFSIKEKWYKRTDFTITNKRNHKLMCSFWEPFDEEREYSKLPCIIYLHGNSSSRCEAIPEIKYLLPNNITIFAFDFSGCGHSEGEYISLGWHEQDDVECIVNFLRKSNKVSTIGLWGRSMGAVTALMYGSRDLSIAGLVLDSPFSSLKLLINELAKDRVALPDFIIKQAIKWIKEIIKEKADFNLDNIEPRDYASKCYIPAFFCHSKGDTFVNIHHSKDLFNLYAGDKNIVYVKGNHNSERPIHFKDSVAIFFYKALRCKALKERYENNKLFNFKFNMDNNDEYFNLKNNKNINWINKNEQKNNSIGEIKISLRGRYNKNNSFDEKKKNEINNHINNNKSNIKGKLTKNNKDIIINIDENITMKNIVEGQKTATHSNYIKYLNEVNNTQKKNKKLFGPVFNSSLLNKTPSKQVEDEEIIDKNNNLENTLQNEKDEDIIQKILQLSKKEFEEISTNTPNIMNNTLHNKLQNKIKKNGKIYNSKSNKNNSCIEKNKLENFSINKTMKAKHSIFSVEKCKNTKFNQNDISINSNTSKIFKKKNNVVRMNKINKISKNSLKNNNNNNNNNNIFKTIKSIKTNKIKNIPFIPSYMINNYPKPSPIKISFPNLLLKLNNPSKINNNEFVNVKNNKKNINNYNNISIHHIYNLKNKNNFNIKNNLKNEEHKNRANDLLEKVIASQLNNHMHGNINKNKNIQYINTTINSSTNNILINNYIKKNESSIDNDSDTIVNCKIENKINESINYLEDDDNFFLEEDNLRINIPHT